MNFDSIMQWVGPALSAVIGWFLHELWAAVKELRDDMRELERELPQHYIRKEDYRADITRVHELLDKIYEKLEGKVDR
jgi:hypothetical protein